MSRTPGSQITSSLEGDQIVAECAGCGEASRSLHAFGRMASVGLREQQWALVAGLGWICDSCKQAVWAGYRGR